MTICVQHAAATLVKHCSQDQINAASLYPINVIVQWLLQCTFKGI